MAQRARHLQPVEEDTTTPPSPETPTIAPPNPGERSILSDLVAYGGLSALRLTNMGSSYGELVKDLLGLIDGILNPDSEQA